jgi:uncharacterized NAD(P)/FAD-binding protein YdhS
VVEYENVAEVTFCLRSPSQRRVLLANQIVNCRIRNINRFQDELVSGLIRSGVAKLDTLQIGIETAKGGSLISALGEASDCIYIIGPVRKARLWETTAVAEIREQARDVASRLLDNQNVLAQSGVDSFISPCNSFAGPGRASDGHIIRSQS